MLSALTNACKLQWRFVYFFSVIWDVFHLTYICTGQSTADSTALHAVGGAPVKVERPVKTNLEPTEVSVQCKTTDPSAPKRTYPEELRREPLPDK